MKLNMTLEVKLNMTLILIEINLQVCKSRVRVSSYIETVYIVVVIYSY